MAILSLIFILQFSYTSNSKTDVPDRLRDTQIDTRPTSTCTFYKWFDPNTNDKEGKLLLKNCSSCHMAYYNEWLSDKHSMSQNNPFFLEIYKQFKQDHPDKNGNCALCHNPEAALDRKDAPMGRLNDINLSEIKSKNTNGISCDFCHKIESVDQNPLKKGVAGLKIVRPCKGFPDIRFGPLKDPVQPQERIGVSGYRSIGAGEELKYNSLYKTSLSCAKCHDGSHGNVQIYSTFTVWLNSPAANKGVQCQSCHMAPRKSTNSIVDNPDVKHKERPYYQIHNHRFLTENPHEFRKKYVNLHVEVGLKPTSTNDHKTLIVTCKVENNNFGHSFPTGSPMRNAILVLDVKCKDSKGKVTLPIQIKGPRLPNYAGNLKNKPGKLFAKILAETNNEYATQHGKAGIVFRKIASELGIPAQDWWNVFVLSDTRIKANSNDISTYEFDVETLRRNVSTNGNNIVITARLIWRNTWPGLAKVKGFKLKEDVLIEKKLVSQNP